MNFETAKKELKLLMVGVDKNDGRDTTIETNGFELSSACELDDRETMLNTEELEQTRDYDNKVIELARIIDIRYVGSGIWYTSAYSSEKMDGVKEKGKEIIQDFGEFK
jgi:hypothetical protein